MRWAHWQQKEAALGITASNFVGAGEVQTVDGIPDRSGSYIYAATIAVALGLPGWWPTKVVATVEGQPFDMSHLSNGDYVHIHSAEAFAQRRCKTLRTRILQ